MVSLSMVSPSIKSHPELVLPLAYLKYLKYLKTKGSLVVPFKNHTVEERHYEPL